MKIQELVLNPIPSTILEIFIKNQLIQNQPIQLTNQIIINQETVIIILKALILSLVIINRKTLSLVIISLVMLNQVIISHQGTITGAEVLVGQSLTEADQEGDNNNWLKKFKKINYETILSITN